MLHKISEFVNRVRVMNDEAQRLYRMKYDIPKAPQVEIDNQIQNIQSMALSIAKDTSDYSRVEDV
mgnify:FL=1